MHQVVNTNDIDILKVPCETFAALPRVAAMKDPQAAKYQCRVVSEMFIAHLKQYGIEGTLFGAYGYKTPAPRSAYPPDRNWDTFGHMVVVVGDTWIDWTVRQMNADAPFPYIANAWEEIRNWKHGDASLSPDNK